MSTDSLRRIWLNGTFLQNGNIRYLVRLLPDGVIDPTFDTGGALRPTSKITPLPDGGALLVEGALTSRLTRLLPSGQIDPSFTRPLAWTYDVQADGRIVYGWGPDNPPGTLQIARAMPNGAPDPTFTAPVALGTGRSGRTVQLATVRDLMVTPWGEIIATANGPLANVSLVWLGANGALRATYSEANAEDGRFKLIGVDDERAVYVSGGSAPGVVRFTSEQNRVALPFLNNLRSRQRIRRRHRPGATRSIRRDRLIRVGRICPGCRSQRLTSPPPDNHTTSAYSRQTSPCGSRLRPSPP